MTPRLTPRLRDERGVALAFAILVLSFVTVVAVGALRLATSNATASDRTRVDEVALFAAEAGIDLALSRLNQATDPRVATLLPSTTATVGTAAVTYAGTYDATTRRWSVTSTATAPTPAGGTSDLTRTVVQDLAVSRDVVPVSENPAWNYLYSDRTDGCTEVHSSAEIRNRLYVKNDLCLLSSAKIFAAAGEVQVGGPYGIWKDSSSSYVGDSSNRLPTLRVANRGCKLGGTYGTTTGYAWPCTTSQQVYATTQTTGLTSVTKPPLDLAGHYDTAAPGPRTACGPGSSYNGGAWPATYFDNNTTMGDGTVVRNIMPPFDYTCVVNGTTVWAWDYTGSGPGTMTINGTVFIDGSIKMNSSETGRVNGTGTIYVSKRVTLDSSVQICGRHMSPWDSSRCDWNNWNPDTNMLVLVAGDVGGSTSSTCGSSGVDTHTCSIFLGSSVDYQGAMYSANVAWMESSAEVQGPIVGHGLRFLSSVGARSIPLDLLPWGTPAVGNWIVEPVPGTWREG